MRKNNSKKKYTNEIIPIEGAKVLIPSSAKVQAMMLAIGEIVAALGLNPGEKSLNEIVADAVHAAKMSKAVRECMSSTLAYIDGALDALNAGKLADITLTKSLLTRAQSDVIATISSVQADGAQGE